MEIKRLIRIDFDNLENSDQIIETHIKTFVGNDKLSAYGVLSGWVNTMKDIKIYTGYNGEIYPQYRIETEQVYKENK